jgi:membrane AbrB-like protein
VAVGASFTPALVDKLWGMTGSILAMVPYMVLVTFVSVSVLTHVARFDRPTAFFAAAPGGLADMVIMAEDAGANLRHVTLVQASRLMAIVFLVPFWLQFGEGRPLGGAVPKTTHIGDLLLVDTVLIVALAWAGWRLGERMGLLGASMVGPMLLSGLAHGFGLTTVKVPVEALIFTQITLGITIGANFKGVSLREIVTVLSWGFLFALFLVFVAAGFAILMSRLTGIDPTTLLLCYAPGGQNEMAILGLILGIDVAVIALHHFVRVFMVIIGAQVVFRAHPDWRRNKGPALPAQNRQP